MKNNEDILETVMELIKALVPGNKSISKSTDLVSDLEFDSMKVMKLVEQIEDRFDISVPLNILPDIRTVEDFAAQLQRIIDED